MTNNNSTRKKANAVFFAAIMVVSMVAVGFAAAPAAAAVNDNQVNYTVDGNVNPGVVYQGQDVIVNGSQIESGNEYTLRSVNSYGDDGESVSSSTFEGEYDTETDDRGDVVIEIDTSNLESGDYYISGADINETKSNAFELTVQDLSVEWEEDSYDTGEESAELNFESQRNSYNVNVSADGLDYQDLYAIFNTTNNDPVNEVNYSQNDDDDEIIVRGFRDDNLEANFSAADIDAGDYEFEVEAYDTAASDTASVTIEEEDTDASFSDSVVTDAAGDVVNMSVELEDSDSTFVSIGGEDVGFFDVVYVEDDDDDDEVTFQVNTRTLGTNESENAYYSEDDNVETSASELSEQGATFTSEDGDSNNLENVSAFRTSSDGLDQNELARPAQAGEYDLIASGDGAYTVDSDGDLVVEDELDISTLDLVEPTIDGVTTHTAPSDNTDASDDVSELLEDVTASEDIALDDRLVIQVEADGIEGDIAQRSDVSLNELNEGVEGDDLKALVDDDSQGVNFNVEATSATANQDPAELDLAQTTVYFADGQFFVVADTREGSTFDSVSDGDDFEVTYEYVTDDDERYSFGNDDATPGWKDAEYDTFPYFAAGDEASAEATFTMEERSATFDNENADDQIEVGVNEESSITGTTNVAPGTDVSVRLRSASGVSPQFILTDDDAEISEDGTFEATMDTTEGEVDNEATLRFRVGSTNVEEIDAILVEQVEEEDGEDGEDTEDGEDGEDTEDGEDGEDTEDGEDGTDDGEDGEDGTDDGDDGSDGDDGDDGESEDGTPGFGALVALVALIAAALLATRRHE